MKKLKEKAEPKSLLYVFCILSFKSASDSTKGDKTPARERDRPPRVFTGRACRLDDSTRPRDGAAAARQVAPLQVS